ncbi:hypothetical protein GWI33_012207 [Rhynchophorus ferrugineus]|uniref:Uncharacterized protein n=1 Tax=Rhynchophorus ferrugineus TaxID=354439 RepID=A0A834I8M1_RHYFE|nr:hypothetical protein GWI33_012207 [Rhynchophorus ferrugineus]
MATKGPSRSTRGRGAKATISPIPSNSTHSLDVKSPRILPEKRYLNFNKLHEKFYRCGYPFLFVGLENIVAEYGIRKIILSITTDSEAQQFVGDAKRIPGSRSIPHLLNLIVDGTIKENPQISEITNRVKATVTYFKQPVNGMEELRAKQKGYQLTPILDMLESFSSLSASVAKL